MKPTVLISRCLVGENVRYDGGNCLISSKTLIELKSEFNLELICPEVLAGMPIPRKPIEFVEGKIIRNDGVDLTKDFEPVFKYLNELISSKNIKYAILKEESPSCGSQRIYDGTFSGNKVKGEGIVTQFLKRLGVKVFSEENIRIDEIKKGA